jgi:hypothetical protein
MLYSGKVYSAYTSPEIIKLGIFNIILFYWQSIRQHQPRDKEKNMYKSRATHRSKCNLAVKRNEKRKEALCFPGISASR